MQKAHWQYALLMLLAIFEFAIAAPSDYPVADCNQEVCQPDEVCISRLGTPHCGKCPNGQASDGTCVDQTAIQAETDKGFVHCGKGICRETDQCIKQLDGQSLCGTCPNGQASDGYCLGPSGSAYCGQGYSCPAGNECEGSGKGSCRPLCAYGRASDGGCIGPAGTVYCGGGNSCPSGTQCIYANGRLICQPPPQVIYQ